MRTITFKEFLEIDKDLILVEDVHWENGELVVLIKDNDESPSNSIEIA